MIALLVVTDGRDDYLAETIASARVSLPSESILERWMYDDTGDDEYRHKLKRTYPEFIHVNGGDRQGFGGAIAVAWEHLARRSNASHVLHLEQDFTFNRPVPLDDMEWLLQERPYVAQVALRRQPWNEAEHLAGGVIEQHPDAYEDHTAGDRHWLEHLLFFTTNPCMYRRSLCRAGWPEGSQSEGRYGHQLRAVGTPEEPDGSKVRFAYWGRRDDTPWVHHIGQRRAGTGY